LGQPSEPVRFGTFRVDLRAAELHSQAGRVKLQEQPFQVLALLLGRAGEVVTREELQKRLWPADTFVDFDDGLNTAIRKLRDALGDSAEQPRFIETVPRRGYRFIHPIETAPPGAVGFPRRPMLVLGTILVLAVVAGVAIAVTWRQSRRSSLGQIRSVAVLPLENLTGDAEQDYVVDGLHDEVITQLAQIGSLKVISRTSVMRYKREKKPLGEVARELHVEAVLEGAVRRQAGALVITAQLIHAPTDYHLWAHSYHPGGDELAGVPAQIALAIADVLGVNLSAAERAALHPARRIDAAAYLEYLKGTYHHKKWSPRSTQKALAHLRAAIDIDPTYAPAWAQLGSAYARLGINPDEDLRANPKNLQQARAALDRALRLDPTLRGPHQMLAQMSWEEGDLTSATEFFQRAREIDPAWLGPSTYLVATGRYDEAVAAASRAAEENPLQYSSQLILGWTYFMAGRYDESIAQLNRAIELQPDIYHAHYELAWNHIKKGDHGAAIKACDRALILLHAEKSNTPRIEACGWVYAVARRTSDALATARWLESTDRKGRLLTLAKIYDALGDRDRAFSYLTKVESSANPLRDNRMLSDGLKADPRFGPIVERQRRFPPPTGALAEVRAQIPQSPARELR